MSDLPNHLPDFTQTWYESLHKNVNCFGICLSIIKKICQEQEFIYGLMPTRARACALTHKHTHTHTHTHKPAHHLVMYSINAVVVLILLRIREVPDSNLGLETGYPDWGFCGFPQLLQANASIYQSIFAVVTCCVLFDVRTEFVTIIYINFGFRGWNTTPRGHMWDRRYLLEFLYFALKGSEWSVDATDVILPVKEPTVPIGQEAGWASQPVWTRWRRIFLLPLAI
jgi:hypothetical protein